MSALTALHCGPFDSSISHYSFPTLNPRFPHCRTPTVCLTGIKRSSRRFALFSTILPLCQGKRTAQSVVLACMHCVIVTRWWRDMFTFFLGSSFFKQCLGNRNVPRSTGGSPKGRTRGEAPRGRGSITRDGSQILLPCTPSQ